MSPASSRGTSASRSSVSTPTTSTRRAPRHAGLGRGGQEHDGKRGIAREAQRAQRDLILHQVRADVDSARLAVRAALALLEADQEAVEAASERQRLAEARYASGAGSALELSDAILSRTSAEAQLVQAEYQLASARAQLLRALGRG